VRAGKSLIVNQKYVRQINVRKYSVQITTPFVSQNLEVSEGGIKQLRERLGK
jgi:hypothetical protein